ncbi:hypothetical protein HPB50_006759 [Hyalomma asiaticum]|uniref:Uncharacterized protein n=1 Tax=Hyalomma asiaticum TaxID=266040 RepID=A0ACB7SQZ1_HYAAI|nr:hypothetical protein HPB50_006759 [Hyalomma asiaticum]
MTAPQQKLFVNLGDDRVCVDSTHGFDFQLVTVLCVDEFVAGFPMAYCITNRTDQKAVGTFFQASRSKTGQMPLKAFVTDDAP